jgi:spore photoproduct lyase
VELAVDTAKTFRPKKILLLRKLQRHPEAARIVGMFPEAQVQVVDSQRRAFLGHPSARTVVDAKRVLMIGEASSFLRRFDGCPGNVRCASYVKLVPISNGCPYYCTYCYLAYVYRDYLPFIKMNINYGRMCDEIRDLIAFAEDPISFNMGEMLDSLALDHVSLLMSRLVPLFARLARGCLMLLTKSANVEGLLSLPPNDRTVVSWSLNTQPMIERFEVGAASLQERIDAAKRCREHGYRIRLRIDPGILYPEWRQDYAELIHRSLAVLEPENITLGMLRLLPGHFPLARRAYGDRGAQLQKMALPETASDGKHRYFLEQRIEFYRALADMIRSSNSRTSIGLCRETPEVWDSLKALCDPGKCNCLIWQ